MEGWHKTACNRDHSLRRLSGRGGGIRSGVRVGVGKAQIAGLWIFFLYGKKSLDIAFKLCYCINQLIQ